MSNEVTTINWPGASGRRYKYWIYPLGHEMKAAAGNYCFAKQTAPGRWSPVYFGQTGNLSERFENHHKMTCALRYGATHIHAHLNAGGDQARLDEETDLVRQWSPPCNG